MFTTPAPEGVQTEQLRAELAAAGIDTHVYLLNGDLVLSDIEESSEVSALVAAHQPDGLFGLSEDDVKRRVLVAKPSETWTQEDRDEALRLALARGLT